MRLSLKVRVMRLSLKVRVMRLSLKVRVTRLSLEIPSLGVGLRCAGSTLEIATIIGVGGL